MGVIAIKPFTVDRVFSRSNYIFFLQVLFLNEKEISIFAAFVIDFRHVLDGLKNLEIHYGGTKDYILTSGCDHLVSNRLS